MITPAKLLGLALCAAPASADLRWASQPKEGWKTQQRNHQVPFNNNFALYMEPSDFNYQGLKEQRDGGGYDNFLRSNIDNEQDRRNFNTEAGEDHLPFRSYATMFTDASGTVKHKMKPATNVANLEQDVSQTEPGDYIFTEPGVPYNVPLRWNNPHSSELEINIWIMNKGKPYVIPIRKPTCSGEGYQDNAFTFTVPMNFNQKASCRTKGECVLQVYAHSVESRMYASGVPIVVKGGTGAWNPDNIKPAEKDVAWDLAKLRRLCLPSSDPANEADHRNTVVYEARLSSDVFNHAYQNSDFSPYAGQQPQHISQNLQASCIMKMATGNFGELGKKYMQKTANEARDWAGKLQKKGDNIIRNYEIITNSIIEAIKYDQQNKDTLPGVVAPMGSVMCYEWRDNYNKDAAGRLRGADRTGGWCEPSYTCLCKEDCKGDGDAYCAQLEAGTGNTVMQVKAGTSKPRQGISAQKTETCFRCAEVGSTKVHRENTNTYIPSFEIMGPKAVEMARELVAPIYYKSGFLLHPDTGMPTQKNDEKAIVQIYMASVTDMWDDFKNASTGAYLEKHYTNKWKQLGSPAVGDPKLDIYKFTYRGPVLKTTTTTLSDANGGVDNNFKKLDANGNEDGGYYSASKAWPLQSLTGSSVQIPLNQAGPLNGQIPRTINMAGNEKYTPASTGGSGVTFKMPPYEVPDAASCSRADILAAMTGTITPEGRDMDGLERDADCDEDAFVEAWNAKHDAYCAAEIQKDDKFVCPPYPDVECHIKGDGMMLPTQMFQNIDDTLREFNNGNSASGAGVIAPALALLAAPFLL